MWHKDEHMLVPDPRRSRVFALGLVLAAGLPPPALAAGDAAAPIAARATKAFRQGDYARALVAFEEAVTLVERGEGAEGLLPVLRFNLARCLEELGRPREAIAGFERYLEVPDSDTARARATERIAELERRFMARLVVECRPGPARLQVNGRAAGNCGEPLTRLEPGVVEVVARRADDLVARQTFTLTAGVETRATLSFGARIRVEAPSGDALQVRVDDAAVAGPPYVADVEPGPHRVDVQLPDGRPWHREARLASGATLVLRPLGAEAGAPVQPAESTSPLRTPWPWVSLGGAAVAGGLGAWFWSQALDNAEATQNAVEIYNGSRDPATRAEAHLVAKNARSDTENQRIAAYGLVAGAVVLAGVGVYLLWPTSGDSAPATPGTEVSAGPGGVSWSGRW